MNEGEYLEMANQLKEKYEDNEKKIKKYIGKYNELYKTMAICYGLLRSYIDSTDMAEHDFTLSEIRSFLSTSLFSHLEDDDN